MAGSLDIVQYKNNLTNGNFTNIPFWKKENPFAGRNYARFVDHVNQPKQVASILYPNPSRYNLPELMSSKPTSKIPQVCTNLNHF